MARKKAQAEKTRAKFPIQIINGHKVSNTNLKTSEIYLGLELNDNLLFCFPRNLGVSPNKNVYFDWSNVSVDRYVTTTNNSFNSNSWIQITATVTVGGRMEVYINGTVCTYTIRSNADTMPNPLPNTNDPIQIGGATWIPRYFGGRISIVSLYLSLILI